MILNQHHKEDLQKSGLNEDTIKESGIYTVSANEVRNILGFNPTDSIGWAIPYLNNEKKLTEFIRIKPDNPPILDGRVAKYLSPKGSRNRLYIPISIRPKLKDSSTPLYITEGEKKALKAVQEGLACVAVSGVWCWKSKDSGSISHTIKDLDLIDWENRSVFIVFDSDA